MANPEARNDYMEQVKAQQRRVEVDLKRRPANVADAPPEGADRRPQQRQRLREQPPAQTVDVRITGWWRFKTVIVPPNAHVVHTRRGLDKPLHIGLGVSFAYDPYRDSFLVVPGTMQTILINAYCICRELQGLLVQGYVQWIIADFGIAYKKLDFSDAEDPMRVVNVQLREQAEAAIKDKVATMGIDEVLSDKQPIIEELTARLRSVAEGEGQTDKGLGLRIVTVQVKEAVVSSTRVWENLQKPFRAERARIARLAEIEAETVISARERVADQEQQAGRLRAEAALDELRAAQEAAAFVRAQDEALARRLKEETVTRKTNAERHETTLQAADLERVRAAKEAEVARQRLQDQIAQRRIEADASVALNDVVNAAQNRQVEAELRLEEVRQRIANDTTPGNLQARLIAQLPALVEQLPQPTELRAVTIGGGGDAARIGQLVAELLAVVDAVRPPARQVGG